MSSYPVGPADIELPPTEPIDISWALEASSRITIQPERSGVIAVTRA